MHAWVGEGVGVGATGDAVGVGLEAGTTTAVITLPGHATAGTKT